MGVPAFFRWLSRKYPSIVVHCVEDKPQGVDGVQIPVDCCLPNPNGVEFDNLYLDMNGIIHPCCHPENKPAPKDEDEMMVAIFEYIDRLFRIIRPRRLLYMAIDGVAPRAKMNQQRSRRFRASKETVEKVDEIARIRQRLEESGATLPPEKKKEEHFDSNCITPGTPFMDRLAKCLHYYIHDRMNSDPAWQKIEVILSDANVPGEGEHKIMDYIRRQRASPAHDPDTHHCLCGADADLIMLGLATHETNFTIIREEFRPNQPRSCELCSQVGHEMKDCMGVPKESAGQFNEIEVQPVADQEFIFLRLNVLREYLERELEMFNLPFQYDFERALDDWVFMCFFVGNDFLPHLPSLEIREGAIDRLIGLYKRAVYNTGGYLTDSGMVNLDRVQVILKELGEMEDEIFKRRQENEISFKQRQKERKKRMKTSKPLWIPSGQFAPVPIGSSPGAVQDARKEAYHMRVDGISRTEKKLENVEAAQALKAMLRGEDVPPPPSQSQGVKRKADEAGLGKNDSDSEPEPPDDVRLWEDGWKDRYYESKFEVSSETMPFRWQVAAAYAQGLCWVLQYYYQGCPSWKWFFPYHYAPFASDFVNIGDLSNRFERGTQPFNPLEQLMGVFPAASQQHLPKPWAKLMWRDDSPIIDFYPTNFKIDLNGKKFAWQGVALLPFVDERRLLKALGRVYPFLTDDERRRNVRGDDRMYVQRRHKGFDFVLGFYEGSRDYSKEFELNPGLFYGLSGTILLANDAIEPGGEVCSPVPGCPDLQDNQVACVRFRDPKFKDEYVFQATRHPKAKEAVRVLRPQDLDAAARNSWRPMIGMAPPTQRASLGPAGPRMIGHAQWSPRDGGSGYGCAIPPPTNYGHNTGQHHHHHHQQQQQQRGPGNRWGGDRGGGGGHRGGGGGGGRGGDGYGGRREWRHTGQQQYQQQQQQQQGGGGWRGPRPQQQQQHQGGGGGGRGHRGGGGHSYYGGGEGGGGGRGGQQRQHLRFSY